MRKPSIGAATLCSTLAALFLMFAAIGVIISCGSHTKDEAIISWGITGLFVILGFPLAITAAILNTLIAIHHQIAAGVELAAKIANKSSSVVDFP